MDLVRRVERFLRTSAMTASRLGRDALGDPRFVADLRNGRQPRAATVARVTAYIEKAENELAGGLQDQGRSEAARGCDAAAHPSPSFS